MITSDQELSRLHKTSLCHSQVSIDSEDDLRLSKRQSPTAAFSEGLAHTSDPLLWNSLPENIRAIRSIGQFKKELNRAVVTFDAHSAIL